MPQAPALAGDSPVTRAPHAHARIAPAARIQIGLNGPTTPLPPLPTRKWPSRLNCAAARVRMGTAAAGFIVCRFISPARKVRRAGHHEGLLRTGVHSSKCYVELFRFSMKDLMPSVAAQGGTLLHGLDEACFHSFDQFVMERSYRVFIKWLECQVFPLKALPTSVVSRVAFVVIELPSRDLIPFGHRGSSWTEEVAA